MEGGLINPVELGEAAQRRGWCENSLDHGTLTNENQAVRLGVI